jgi:hypothetical protein
LNYFLTAAFFVLAFLAVALAAGAAASGGASGITAAAGAAGTSAAGTGAGATTSSAFLSAQDETIENIETRATAMMLRVEQIIENLIKINLKPYASTHLRLCPRHTAAMIDGIKSNVNILFIHKSIEKLKIRPPAGGLSLI